MGSAMEWWDGEGRGEPMLERGGAAANNARVAMETTAAWDGQRAAYIGGSNMQ